MSYMPQPDSCAGRVCAYFLANPEEELTNYDIVAKFGCGLASVRALMFEAVSHHLLSTSRDERNRLVYAAGSSLVPKLSRTDVVVSASVANGANGASAANGVSADSHPGTAPAPAVAAPANTAAPATTALPAAAPATGATSAVRVIVPLPDLAALQVVSDVPLPKLWGRLDQATIYWADMFGRLTAAGMSVQGLPLSRVTTIRKAVEVWRKAHPGQTFAVRRTGQDACGVWRTA